MNVLLILVPLFIIVGFSLFLFLGTWLNMLFGILALLGVFLMWFAIFGKKKDIDEGYTGGTGGTSGLVGFILDLIYAFSPTIVKRVMLFLLGLLLTILFTLGTIYA